LIDNFIFIVIEESIIDDYNDSPAQKKQKVLNSTNYSSCDNFDDGNYDFYGLLQESDNISPQEGLS